MISRPFFLSEIAALRASDRPANAASQPADAVMMAAPSSLGRCFGLGAGELSSGAGRVAAAFFVTRRVWGVQIRRRIDEVPYGGALRDSVGGRC